MEELILHFILVRLTGLTFASLTDVSRSITARPLAKNASLKHFIYARAFSGSSPLY